MCRELNGLKLGFYRDGYEHSVPSRGTWVTLFLYFSVEKCFSVVNILEDELRVNVGFRLMFQDKCSDHRALRSVLSRPWKCLQRNTTP
jgi:hypothetical protein